VQQKTVQMTECLAVNCFKFVFVKHLQAYTVITAGMLAVPTIQIVVEQCFMVKLPESKFSSYLFSKKHASQTFFVL